MKSTLTPLALALALAAPVALAAQQSDEVYRSVMPDGTIRYGESPAPGAKSVKKIPAPPPTTGTITATPEEVERAKRAPVATGGTAVLSQPERKSPDSHEQGRFQSPKGLPRGAY